MSDYIQATINALNREQTLEQEEKAKCNRHNVTCVFFCPSERPYQLHVNMVDGPSTEELSSWALGSQETITFVREGRLLDMNAQVIRQHSIFAIAPPPIAQGAEMASGWTGKTYMKGSDKCAMIANDLSGYVSSGLLATAAGTQCRGVTIQVEIIDTRRIRIDRGLEILELVMKHEQGIPCGVDLKVHPYITQYKLNLSSLFIAHQPYVDTPGPLLTLKQGLKWQLVHPAGNSTQRAAIQMVLGQSKGITCI